MRLAGAALLAAALLAACGCGASTESQATARSDVRGTRTDVHPKRSTNCMPTPSECGFPDMHTTGVIPGTKRKRVTGTVTLSKRGQVYENKTVTGNIVVNAPNVTIRNVELHSRAFWGIRCRIVDNTNCSNLLVQNSEIDLDGAQDVYGIIEDNYTLDHVQIHDGADCAHTGKNVVIKNTFCSLGTDTNDDGWADAGNVCQSGANGTPHYDGFQSDGGSNLTFDHNTIRNPCSQTSAILMSSNVAPISNVTITNNLMAGGGYTLYCAATNAVGGTEIVTGNRIARTYRRHGGYYGPFAYCDNTTRFGRNVWDDTGRAIKR